MSSKEFGEWMAYEKLEPSEPYRGDAQTALICFTIVNTLRQLIGAKGTGPKFTDFLLKFEPKTLVRIPYEQLEAKMKGWLHSVKDDQDKRKVWKRGKYRKHSGNPEPQ